METTEIRDDAKRLANLRARCALAGVECHPIVGDNGRPEYLCHKWAMTKRLETLDALAQWVAQVDGKSE